MTSHISGQTLVVSYRDPEAVERHFTVLVFTRFHATDPLLPFVAGGEDSSDPGADTLVLRAPTGYTVTGDYTSAMESETTVQWHTDGKRDPIDRSTRVTCVDDLGPFTGIRTALARWVV